MEDSCFLNTLPSSILFTIISEYLLIHDISMLDQAVAQTDLRMTFLQCLKLSSLPSHFQISSELWSNR